jgi:hypothetical protein
MMRVHRLCQFACLGWLTACGWQPDETDLITPTRPPAAAIVPMREATPLEEMLAMLDQELRTAIDGELQGEAEAALIRAEAITDRLPEARLPFNWLLADQYSLDARLRQIQSQADRVVAALFSGQPRDYVMGEADLFQQQVTALRHTIAQGGGPPRVHVDRLIEALDTLRTVPGAGQAAPPPPVPPRPPPLTAPPG